MSIPITTNSFLCVYLLVLGGAQCIVSKFRGNGAPENGLKLLGELAQDWKTYNSVSKKTLCWLIKDITLWKMWLFSPECEYLWQQSDFSITDPCFALPVMNYRYFWPPRVSLNKSSYLWSNAAVMGTYFYNFERVCDLDKWWRNPIEWFRRGGVVDKICVYSTGFSSKTCQSDRVGAPYRVSALHRESLIHP